MFQSLIRKLRFVWKSCTPGLRCYRQPGRVRREATTSGLRAFAKLRVREGVIWFAFVLAGYHPLYGPSENDFFYEPEPTPPPGDACEVE